MYINLILLVITSIYHRHQSIPVHKGFVGIIVSSQKNSQEVLGIMTNGLEGLFTVSSHKVQFTTLKLYIMITVYLVISILG